uniref:Uncharacterized protein n=1 Tax=Grammatophora oceanica TaxID=210454 RepID=A0A7S1YDX9_9STRA
MSFPVARAAVRYVLGRVKERIVSSTTQNAKDRSDADDDDEATTSREVTFITGVGKNVTSPTTTLRDYIVNCLQQDFVPPIEGTVPPRAMGTVCVSTDALQEWIQQAVEPQQQSPS